ncbi:Zn(II)/Cd(II)/Pb(II) translocating P-type ATPase ZntA, partial [Atlantibacter hermannii]
MTTPTPDGKPIPQFGSVKFKPLDAQTSCCADGQCSQPAPQPLTPPSAAAQRFSWHVQGMDCAACARKVENAARQIPGVSQAQVVFATEKLLVDAAADVREQVEQAIRQAGYTLTDSDSPAPPPS